MGVDEELERSIFDLKVAKSIKVNQCRAALEQGTEPQ